MYNQEIKERFLNDRDSAVPKKSASRIIGIFKDLADLEEKLGKDLVSFTPDEVDAAVSHLLIVETGTLRNILALLRKYAVWCSRTRVLPVADNGFLILTESDIDLAPNQRRMLFKDERVLLSALRQVMPFDEGRPEIPAMLLSWLGLSRTEIDLLKDDWVDLDARTIQGPSGNIIVNGFSDEIHEALNQYVRCKVRYVVGGRGGKPYPLYKDFTFDTFLKQFYSPNSTKTVKALTVNAVQSTLNQKNQKYENLGNPPRLTLTNAWNSGCYYRLWEIEKTGVDICAPSQLERFNAVTREIKARQDAVNTYQVYKRAFHLSVDT